jgi:hypothetical protein
MATVIGFLKKFNELGLQALHAFIMEWLGTLAPVIKLPIINQIISAYIKKRLVELKTSGQTVQFHFVASVFVSEQLKKYLEVMDVLLAKDVTPMTEEEKNKLNEEIKNQARIFASIRNP